MRRLKTRLMLFAVVAATALAGVSACSSRQSAGPSGLVAKAATHPADLTSSAPVTVVARGLYEPRSLAWGPHGHLLVSEAGTPGPVCKSTECFGLTGSVSDISSGKPVRIVKRLASILEEQEGKGPDGLTYADGHLYTLETGSPRYVPSGLPAGLTAALKTQYGALLDITGGSISVVANPSEADYQWSRAHKSLAPPKEFPDTNPYALTAKPGGGFYLVDAASNTLDSVDRQGKVRVVAFIPPTPAGTDAVPTCLSMGPDGTVYVGEMTGTHNSGTAANVYRYAPRSGSLMVWQSGFSAINGCGFGANGDFYVTELDTTGFLPKGAPEGAVIQISTNGKRTVLGAGKLFAPSGFLAGRDGSIYVANNCMIWPPVTAKSSGPVNAGEVVKIG